MKRRKVREPSITSALMLEKYAKSIRNLVGSKDIMLESIDKDDIMPKTLKQAQKLNKVIIMNPENTCAIKPNNELTYQLLTRYISNMQCDYEREPKMDFTVKADSVNRARFTLEYVKKSIAIADVFADCVNISLKNEYPAMFSIKNDLFDLDIILAPLVEFE